MINLLATEEKHALQAAKTNVLLLRYNIALIGFLGLVVIAFVFVYVMLNVSENSAKGIIASNNAKVASYSTVRQQAKDFEANLSTAKKIFAGDINYTGLITSIANSMPPNTVLQQLSLSPSTLGKPSTLTAEVKSTQDALALKDAFTANPKLFTGPNLLSITKGASQSGYPYTVVMNVTINSVGF